MFDKERLCHVRKQGEQAGRTGVVFSAWDLLHAGHCLFLAFARARCDFLVAGLHVDPRRDRPWKHAPVMALEERRIVLQANRHVDAVIDYETEQDHYDILVALAPQIRFFGSDYLANGPYTGKDLTIPIVYHNRDHGWSTSELRRRIWQAEETSHKD